MSIARWVSTIGRAQILEHVSLNCSLTSVSPYLLTGARVRHSLQRANTFRQIWHRVHPSPLRQQYLTASVMWLHLHWMLTMVHMALFSGGFVSSCVVLIECLILRYSDASCDCVSWEKSVRCRKATARFGLLCAYLEAAHRWWSKHLGMDCTARQRSGWLNCWDLCRSKQDEGEMMVALCLSFWRRDSSLCKRYWQWTTNASLRTENDTVHYGTDDEVESGQPYVKERVGLSIRENTVLLMKIRSFCQCLC